MGSNCSYDAEGIIILTTFCTLLTTLFTIVSFLLLLYINSQISDIKNLLIRDSIVQQLIKKDIIKLPDNIKVKEQ